MLAGSNVVVVEALPRTTRHHTLVVEHVGDELRRGVVALGRKIRRLRPSVIAFVGLTLYQRFFGYPRSGGPGLKPERVEGAYVFVLPNPSGLNASFPGFADKLVWFEALRRYLDELYGSAR